MTRIDTLKVLLQISGNSQDNLINALVDQCEGEYITRTNQEEADDTIVNAMVIEKFNRLGNEGVSSMGYSGISESYESDYSESIQKLIRAKTRLKSL